MKIRDLIRDNRRFLVFLALFAVFRTAVADWNPVPSGSMRPTIIEGDVVLVNRLAYALKLPLTDVELLRTGEPQRGDVATFSSPRDGTRLVKRIVAVGGDVVAMRDGVLWINGEAARHDAMAVVDAEPVRRRAVPKADQPPRGATSEASVGVPVTSGVATLAQQADETIAGSRRRVQWLPRAPSMRDFDEVTVPRDHVMALGDNRDNSLDSRYYGFVARRLLIGRAHRILVSGDIARFELRTERIGRRL
jgi:signal peptidase I